MLQLCEEFQQFERYQNETSFYDTLIGILTYKNWTNGGRGQH